MSNDEKKAAIGGMALEYGEAKKTLATARGAAQGLASKLKELARALKDSPESIRYESDSLRFKDEYGSRAIELTAKDLDLGSIGEIGSTAASAIETINNLAPHLRELGIEDVAMANRYILLTGGRP